ncbi:hypothetical protein [Bifidobacterium olomucense]|uniref:Uncharacterized protein n=1 Tax=Bifidobacterium olomucense TaxID=2675324 RepID=A0A7Y0HWF7_9BIFI|nr:hypothetical protein [Bifidobacterium sp. DSM 109959]NMM97247.1 hypothetical protein [Bifidobacterium sp. DSM 109959]
MCEQAYTLLVPSNKEGEKELKGIGDIDLPNCQEFDLTEKESESLDRLFNDYNATFGIIIDYYEEEYILKKDIAQALLMAEKALNRTDDETEQHGLKILISALRLAKDHNTFMEIVG